MRALIVVFALTLVFGVMAPAMSDMDASCPPEPCPTMQPCPPAGAGPAPCPMLTDEQIIEMSLSCSMGLTKEQISRMKAQGLANGDIVIAYAVATKACVPVKDVIAAFLCDKDWNAVFCKYNVTISDLNKCTLITNSDVEAFNRSFIAQYYGLCEADLVALREKGFSWGDISLMANASVRTTQPITTIAGFRSEGMSWTDIGSKYNVCLADLIRPVQMKTTSAQALRGAGPMVSPVVMYDMRGNVLLSYDQANNYYSRGFDWLDVAVAANVSKNSGIPMDNMLERVRTGSLWDDLLIRYCVAPCLAYNVSEYPFPRTSIYSKAIQQMRWNRIEQYQQPTSSLTASPCKPAPTVPCPVVCPGSAPGPCPAPCPPVSSETCPPSSD